MMLKLILNQINFEVLVLYNGGCVVYYLKIFLLLEVIVYLLYPVFVICNIIFSECYP